MRVLFTSQPGLGHWHPHLRRPGTCGGRTRGCLRDHTKACAAIEANGITCFPVGCDESDEVLRERRRSLVDRSPAEQAAFMVREVFAGTAAEHPLPDVLAIGRTWQPAVVVRENLEFTGFLMAEALGLPHAVIQVTAWRPPLHVLAAEALDQVRARNGVQSRAGCARLHR